MTYPSSTRRIGLAAAGAWLLAAAVLLGLAGCSTLDERQRQWIFQPSDRAWWGGLQAAEGMADVWIDYRPAGAAASSAQAAASGPVRLHGLWLAAERADAPVALYLHGARWDVRGSAHRARRIHELGFSVLSIDYRGFGRSTPALPSEDSAAEDAAAAWAWLAERHPDRPRFVFGHSLGGAIAVRLAAGRGDVAGLVVEGTFTSIPDVVGHMRWGWLPVGPLITQRFDAGARIEQVRAPVLVVHGSEDRVIAPALGRALFERARSPKRFVLVEGGSHHNAMASGIDLYRQALSDLWGAVLAPPTQAGRTQRHAAAAPSAGQPAIAQDTGVAPSSDTSTSGAMPTR